tara:strand:+ start:847 stop:2016 length:1170 start_codon:yes stop_codon:yes gene_type:complete
MRVLFFITSSGQGSGGHYHSLLHISNLISNHISVGVISVGNNESPVVLQSDNYIEHIYFRSLTDYVIFRKRLNQRIVEFNPDVVHFFDTESLNLVLLVNSLKKYLVVLNKCGGQNPNRSKWQQVSELVLFSKENYNWFKNHESNSWMNLHLIPKRVTPPVKGNYLNHPEQKSKEKITFLRVSRLGGAYEKTLLDSFNLIEKLSEEYPVELIVVGRIQDEKRFLELRSNGEKRNLPVKYITDARASKGSSFLYLADFVIGTGRSLMEGLSVGKPCLAPVRNSSKPVLITDDNFQALFETNFSERGFVSDQQLSLSLTEIKKIIEDSSLMQQYGEKSSNYFDQYFNINSAFTDYELVYKSGLDNKSKVNLRLKNMLYIFKQLVTMIKYKLN